MRDRRWWAVHREATALTHPGPAPWGGVGCGISGEGPALLAGRAREGCGGLGEERRGLFPRPRAEGERSWCCRSTERAGKRGLEGASEVDRVTVSLPNSRPPGTSECGPTWKQGLCTIRLR